MVSSVPQAIRFILTSFKNTSTDFENIRNSNDDFIIGLSNDDFYLNTVEYPENMEENRREEEITKNLALNIPNYNSNLYINREIFIKSSELDIHAPNKSLIISMNKGRLHDIIQMAKSFNIFISGIYPSFLMGDQNGLKDLGERFDFIDVEEVEDEDNEKVHLALFHDNEPLNLIEKILEGENHPEYDFLLDEYRELFNRPIFNRKTKNIFLTVVLVQLIIYFVITLFTNNAIQKNLQVKNSSTSIENQVKDIEKKIDLVPNWEAKLKKLEQILAQRSVATNEIIYAVKKSVPKGLFIDKLTINSSNVSMIGTTDNVDKIFKFERVLEEMGFVNVKHTTITNSSGAGFSFQIESSLR